LPGVALYTVFTPSVRRVALFVGRLALDRPPGVNRDMDERRVPFLIEGPSFAAGRPEAAAIDAFRSEIFEADALFLFDYWLAKCTGTGVPRKILIDPAELPNLLPALYIEEWDDERRQSRKRSGPGRRRPRDGRGERAVEAVRPLQLPRAAPHALRLHPGTRGQGPQAYGGSDLADAGRIGECLDHRYDLVLVTGFPAVRGPS
jgi:hypothetical protein